MDNSFNFEHFASVYNDRDSFPNLTDVALELGVAYQTVRNRSCILRGLRRRGDDVPELISRKVTAEQREAVSPREHARVRADNLRSEVHDFVQRSRYPVINPEAIVVESYVAQRYDRVNGAFTEKEGTPRTWLTDKLRVEGVADPRGRRFIFAGAQNDAEVHAGFWKNLKAYADHLDADIVVGPWTYETQWWSENNPTSRTYDPRLAEYLCFGEMLIGDDFVFCGEMNTLPTANRPIGDLQTYTGGKWGIFPHAKFQLSSIPSTDPARQACQIMTTGAVTHPKVIPRKAGVKSIFHHVIGAVIVEFDDDGDLFCRQLNADKDGSFYDLDLFVRSGKVASYKGGVKAIVVGDTHLRKLDPSVSRAVFGVDQFGNAAAGSMVETLNPREILVHDIFDNETRNHHHVHDNAYSYEMAIRGRDSVEGEVREVAQFLETLAARVRKVVVVESNHDIGLERYVREGRYRNDGGNIEFGLRMELAYLDWRKEVARCLDAQLSTPSFSLLEFACRSLNDKGLRKVHWVHDATSYMVGDIECGHHGFRGANGARGTIQGFAKLGRKMSIADKHTPTILDGIYVAGCSALHHGYNKGPSGWAIAEVVQYPNDKRAIVTMQKGKWRAER